jgi:ATP-dependent helicase/nuclease subunit A
MNLDPQQLAAARRIGQDVCVDAGPGSGKTRVLVERFAWLVEAQQVPPRRILAITFTEKAAGEIKRRLVERFASEVSRRREIEQAYVSTIHAFCARLLRENAIAAGVDLGFAVLDQSESDALLEEAAERALDELFAERPAAFTEVLESLRVSTSPVTRQLDLAGALRSVYRAVRAAAVPIANLSQGRPEAPLSAFQEMLRRLGGLLNHPDWQQRQDRWEKREQLRRWIERAASARDDRESLAVLADFEIKLDGLSRPLREELKSIRDGSVRPLKNDFAAACYHAQRGLLVEALARIDGRYRERKRAAAALDFADLEERTLELFSRRPDVAERVRRQFDYILMDELQDTSPLQWRILEQIRRPDRFFGVGDINQSIYSFRHAEPELFRSYRDALRGGGKAIDQLRTNYRSRQQILDAAAAILEKAPGIEKRRLHAVRVFPAKDAPAIELIAALADVQEQAEPIEASWIARRMVDLRAELGVRFGDMAVLARKIDGLAGIEQRLRECGIPAVMVGGRTLLETREVLDAWNFLRVLANTQDEIALAGVLRSPLVGVSDETILRLKLGGSLWGALFRLDGAGVGEEDRERLEWFAGLVRALRRQRDDVPPDLLAARIVDESNYLSLLAEHNRQNLEKFFGLLGDLHFRRRRPLAELLAELDRLRASEAASESPPAEAADAVRLMTVHAAKGLEFPVVFLARLHQQSRDDLDPICFSPKHGFGAKWRIPGGNKGVPDPVYAAAEQELKSRTEEEEMRLLYVAMTRAEDHLVLSCARGQRSPGSPWLSRVARWAEWPDDLEEDLEEGDSIRSIGDVRLRQIVSRQPQSSAIRPAQAAETAPVGLAPPVRTGQHDSSAAVTDVGEFTACPRRYYLGRYLGLEAQPRRRSPEAEEEDLPVERAEPEAADLGVQAHALLAGAAVENVAEEAVRLAQTFQRSELARRLERAARVEREFDFAVELEGMVLAGQIDLWFEEGGEALLVDYKTGRPDSPERLEAYEVQLRIYALALERLSGKLPDQALLFFLRTGETAQVALDGPALEATRESIRQFRQAQAALEFPLRQGAQCWSCAYFRGLCPARPAASRGAG